MSPTNSSPNESSVAAPAPATESSTTILSPGVVESRNYTSTRKISVEIQAFISGADGDGGASGIKSEFRAFFTIWMFLTRLPSPSWIDLHPGFLMRGMCYFPVVGSVLGGMYAVLFDCLNVSLGLPTTVAGALTVGFGLYITGCFHEDGLADSADGIGGGWSRGQVLKIMTDSRVGTFGCAALSLFLFVKVQLLGSLGPSNWRIDFQSSMGGGLGPSMLVAQTISRLSAPYLIRTRDYVAEVGPKSPFYLFMVEAKHIVSWRRVFFAAVYCFLVSALLYGPLFASMLIIVVLACAHLAGSKGDYLLGGVMGDFLGGTICICEIVVLILIVTKDSILASYQIAVDAMDSSVNGPKDFSNPLAAVAELYSRDRLRPIFHLALLTASMKVWCTLVGPPDMYDREDGKVQEENGKKDD